MGRAPGVGRGLPAARHQITYIITTGVAQERVQSMMQERGAVQRGTDAAMVQRRPVVPRQNGSSSLADVLTVLLEKGLVVDAWVRLSVIGIEVLTLEARVIVASVDTYLRYAEAIGQTALASPPAAQQRERGGGEERDRAQLDEDEVLSYLEEHPDGVRLGELQAYFDAPRREMRELLDDLVEQETIRRDEERRLYLPAGNE
jgi:gas vesicle structural protein